MPNFYKNKYQSTFKAVLVQVALIFSIYLIIQFYQKRDIVYGVAPAIEANLTNGKLFTLANFKGKPAIVHFWATWCTVCRLEQGTIAALARDNQLITIASQSGSAHDINGYLREHDLDMPVLADEQGQWAQKYGVNAFPTTLIIDAHGNIRHVEVGYTTELGLKLRLALAHRP